MKLVWITPEAEKHIAYCARVSSSQQDNPEINKLLKYCLKHRHMSIFEMASMCLEIQTSRAIAPQILRHRSFSFQEFSQRYAGITSFEEVSPRRQDTKNRQNSFDDLDEDALTWFKTMKEHQEMVAVASYEHAISRGISKESARFLLPLSTSTKLYMSGTIRSWITYLEVRCGPETQKEHRDIANEIKKIFTEQLPIISEALGWKE